MRFPLAVRIAERQIVRGGSISSVCWFFRSCCYSVLQVDPHLRHGAYCCCTRSSTNLFPFRSLKKLFADTSENSRLRACSFSRCPASYEGGDQEAVLGYALSRFGKAVPGPYHAIGGPAAKFAQKYRSRLFPSTPMLMAAVDHRHWHTPI
jgi:hypothetical protein